MTTRTCTKPDRDVAALTCGHPLPCPHHTVIIAHEKLVDGVANVAWLASSRCSITTWVSMSSGVIKMSARPWRGPKDGMGDSTSTTEFARELATNASLPELRAALEEVQIEAMEWLLAKRRTT